MLFEAEGGGCRRACAGRGRPSPASSAPPSPVSAPAGMAEVRVPDIGDFKDVPVIEIFVKVGDTVKAEDPLVSLESDKATMDVPAPLGGRGARRSGVKVGDKVSEGIGDPVARPTGRCAGGGAAAAAPAASAARRGAGSRAAAVRVQPPAARIDEAAFALAYAGPAVRKLARELGVDLGKVKGSGEHGRIVRDDVEAFAKGGGAAAAPAAGKAARRRRRRRRRRPRPAAVAEGRLRQVRPGRAQGAVAHQEDLGRQPAPQLGRDSARHDARRGRHHRARSRSACR